VTLLFAESGAQLVREFRIKIFRPGNETAKVLKMRAPGGHGYSEKDIDAILELTADKIEKDFPGHEYALVPVSPVQFNFVHRGERASS
jgi:hypothetical protein